MTMASKIAARYISRRLSSSGKILSEEEKAAENIYIKVRDNIKAMHSFREKLPAFNLKSEFLKAVAQNQLKSSSPVAVKQEKIAAK